MASMYFLCTGGLRVCRECVYSFYRVMKVRLFVKACAGSNAFELRRLRLVVNACAVYLAHVGFDFFVNARRDFLKSVRLLFNSFSYLINTSLYFISIESLIYFNV